MSAESTVFIIDHDPLARESAVARAQAMGLPVEAFVSAEDFLSNYSSERPGCLVSEVMLPGISGVDLLEKLIADGVTIPVVFITDHPETHLTVKAIKTGAVTLLEKPCDIAEFQEAIRQAFDRDKQQREEQSHRGKIAARLARLTEAERAVLALIVEGLPNKVIARRLNIGLRTVEERRHHIFRKMQAKSVAQLVREIVDAERDDNLPSA